MLMFCSDVGGHGFPTGRISEFEGAAHVSAMFLLLSIGHCRSLMVFGETVFLVGSTVYHDQGLAYPLSTTNGILLIIYTSFLPGPLSLDRQ
jgi:hypothetical protein